MRFGKARDFNEMIQDPNYLFQVGRLIGAAEMTSHYLLTHAETDEMRSMGSRLADVASWFFASAYRPEPVAIDKQVTQRISMAPLQPRE